VILLVETAVVTGWNKLQGTQFPGCLGFTKPDFAKAPGADPAKDAVTVEGLAGVKHGVFVQV
jgi:hypothetical protein